MKIHLIAVLLMLSVSDQIMALEQTEIVDSKPIAAPEQAAIVDSKQVEQWLEKGLAAHKIDDLMGAINWLGKAANQGQPQAQVMLGYLYLRSDEITLALPLFEQAAKQGNVMAQHELSILYAQGYGVKQDFTKALTLLKQAIAQQHLPSIYLLASYYERGQLSLTINIETAVSYYQQASNKGYSTATYRLIRAYKKGELGFPVDKNKEQELKDLLNKHTADKAKAEAEAEVELKAEVNNV